MDLSPGDRVDRFVVEARLGEGGTAVVYRVRHARLDTLHALKVLFVRSPTLVDRMLQEGRIQATIRHENLVAVTDTLKVGDDPALVLEYVDGPNLHTLVTRHPPHLAQVDDLARGILAGVAHAHRAGLIHRDLKPANVLLSTSGGRVVPKVADFGMAKVLDESLRRSGLATRSGVSLGTPAFMAPEQVRDAKGVDARADVFSVGCVLYTLVAGTPPFTGSDPIDLLAAMRGRRWRPVRDWSPSVPARWERAIAAALEPDPKDRPADVDTLLDLWQGDAGPFVSGPVWEAEQVERIRALVEMPRPAPGDGVPAPVDAARTPPPAARSGLLLATAGLLAGAMALSAGGLLGMWIATREPRASVAASSTEPPPSPALPEPVPTVAEPAAVATSVEVPRPAPVARATPEPATAPAPPPAPEPSPPRPDQARVSVQGVERSWLEQADGTRREPGDLPPGRYTLWAMFDATGPTAAMDLDLAAGDRRTVTCVAALRTCR